jgi:hypothetical protein
MLSMKTTSCLFPDLWSSLKVHLHEISDFCLFFHQKHAPGPLICTLDDFQI